MKSKRAPKRAELLRINRFLSMCGVASRRKAEDLLREGRVIVNGRKVSELATRIDPSRDQVFVDGKQITRVHDPVYLVLNKPKDTITTVKDERGRATVMDLVRTRDRVYPIGRLDRNTTGVLLLTNDGDFAHHLMHPRFQIPKAYHVVCDAPVTTAHMRQLTEGVILEDGTTAPASLTVIPRTRGKEIGITIHEGRNRQVRRMFEHLGYEVVKLDRVAYGPVTKTGLPRGATRRLTHHELRELKRLAGFED